MSSGQLLRMSLLEYIREATIPKIAWDSPATLFRKKNDVIPQLLKSELPKNNLLREYEDISVSKYRKNCTKQLDVYRSKNKIIILTN